MSSVGLTGKQKWRRQPHRLRNNHHDLFYTEGLDSCPHFNQPHRAHSDQTISQPNNNMISRAWATTGDLNCISTIDSYERSRRVRFNSAVHVILIPTVEEYRSAGLDEQMWWCEIDYKKFKESAVEELRRYLHENSRADAKSALKILYQPDSKDSTSPVSSDTVQQCPSNSSRNLKSSAAGATAMVDSGGLVSSTHAAKVAGVHFVSSKETSSVKNIKGQYGEILDPGAFAVLPIATKRSAAANIAPSSPNPAFAALAVSLIC